MKKIAILPIVVIFLFITAMSTGAHAQGRTISISVGSSETIKFDNRITGVIRILNSSVADVVSYSKRSVTIVGVAKGVTDLYVPTGSETVRIRIDVSSVGTDKTLRAIKSFMGAPEGVYVRAVGDKIVIGGAVYTAADYSKVMRTMQLFGKKKVVNYAKYRPSAVEQINKTLQRAGMSSVKANSVAGSVFIEGAVGSKNEMEKLKAIIKALQIEVYNLVSLGEGAQVQVKVRFMEISHSDNINFGLELPDAIVLSGGLEGTFPILPQGQSNTLNFNVTMPETALSFKLNTLFSSGNARVLAEPKLVCGSGSKAELHVGGQVPIPMVTANTSSVAFKDFGIRLKLQPVANSRGSITIGLDTEVSDVDWSLAVNGVPGFRTRKVKTTVTMQAGATLIISGLYKNNRSKTIKKFPLLGHIPILGELFKSRAYKEERSSLAIMVTPSIVNAKQIEMKDSIQLVESKFLDFNKYLYWDLFLE